MRVVQINAFYPYGSTSSIVGAIHKALILNDEESYVVYGHGPKVCDPNAIKVASEATLKAQSLESAITGFVMGDCCRITTHRIMRFIKNKKPDIVHLHCINGYLVDIVQLLEFLKDEGISTVITLHAEFMYTGGCGYSHECDKWMRIAGGCGKCSYIGTEHPRSWFFDRTALEWERLRCAYDGFKNLTVVGVSPWSASRAGRSTFFSNSRVISINNGISEKVFHPEFNTQLSEELKGDGKKTVLHVTANFESPNKGGHDYVLDCAKRLRNEPIKFIVIGRAANRDWPENVKYLGQVKDKQKLAQYYTLADLTLLTSRKETFSLVTAESLCCGTPIIGFRAGGPESIAIEEYANFVKYGDKNALAEAVSDMLAKKFERTVIAENAKKEYSIERMCDDYLSLYNECLTEKN